MDPSFDLRLDLDIAFPDVRGEQEQPPRYQGEIIPELPDTGKRLG
jgi:hypothetical protein